MHGAQLLLRPVAHGCDADRVHVEFLREPSLAIPHAHALEVGAEFLVNQEFFFNVKETQFAENQLYGARENHSYQHTDAHDEEGQGLVTGRPNRVVHRGWNGCVDDQGHSRLEDLHVSHDPVAEE